MTFIHFKACIILCTFSLATFNVSAQDWEYLSKMPTPRFYLSAGVVGKKIYAIGGARLTPSARINSSQVEEYDPITDQWVEKAPMPTSRFFFASAVYKEKIFTFGGNKQNAPFSSVEVYDPRLDKWTLKNEMPTPRSSASALTLKDKIYVMGGNVFGAGETDLVERYDPKNDVWERLQNMPVPRSGHISLLVGNKIYVIGGKTKKSEYSNGFVLDVDAYDLTTNTWQTKSKIPNSRFQFSAVVLNEKIYLISGRDEKGISKQVDVYDTKTNTWASAPSLKEGLAGSASVVVDNSIYVLGGRTCVQECTSGDLVRLNIGSSTDTPISP